MVAALGEKVLVLDDDPLVVESLMMALEGWDTLGATSAAQARRLLDAHDVAVLISDARMPEESGVDLLGWAAAKHPWTMRVLLTGYADFATVTRAVNEGKVWHFLRKPWDNLELRSLVRRAVEYRTQLLAVERSERRYRELFHHAMVGVLRCSLDGEVLDANPAVAETLGLDPRTVAEGLNLVERLADPQDWDLFVAKLHGDRTVRAAELSVRHPKRGVARLRLNATLRREDGQWVIEASAVDVTDRTEADALQQSLAERFARVQRLETVATLGSGAVHDLNNLLTVVLGGAAMVALARDDAERDECVSAIESAAQHAGELTSQLLTFLRSGAGAGPQSVDCNYLARDVLKLLRRTVNRKLRLVEDLADDLPHAVADSAQVHQVLMNLCVNACDAMDAQGGTLTLRTRVERVERAADLRPGEYVALRVEDTGPGIDPAVRPRIFEPLFSTKPAGERSGTGLGLALVESIARQRGGSVEVESEPGRGAAFTVRLPAARTTVSEAPPSPLPRRAATVLFVDDEPALRVQARRYLESQGFRVLVATDGQHALEVARAAPSLDVAVMDLVMPVMGGDEALSALRAERPAVRLVLSTGYALTPDRREVLRVEGLRLLRKPYSLDGLAEVVRAALDDAR